jgi:transcriptional regulator with XRE-family HTH domain
MGSPADDRPEAAIGRLVAQLRRTAGLTQEKAAERAEMSVRALRNIELGLVSRPRRRTITALTAALQIDQAKRQELDDLTSRA